MLLDLGRNDVGRVADAGQRRGHRQLHRRILQPRHAHRLERRRPARRPTSDALDALFAGFPAGTVSGAPKVRACEIIAELEPETRGAYAGGVGYFSPDGSMDSCIVLRTAVVKDGVMHVQAGAGIVADSDPGLRAARMRGQGRRAPRRRARGGRARGGEPASASRSVRP